MTRDQIAQIIYEVCPEEDCGEAIGGFQVVPGGPISWEKAKAMDDEFNYEGRCRLTGFAYECADALLARMHWS